MVLRGRDLRDEESVLKPERTNVREGLKSDDEKLKQRAGLCGLWQIVELLSCGRELRAAELHQPGGETAALSRAAFLEGGLLADRLDSFVHRNRVLEAVENFIGRVLKTGVGLVQLTGRLRGELAELVAVCHVCECSEDQI